MGLFYNDEFSDNFGTYNSKNRGNLMNNLNTNNGLDYITKGLSLFNGFNNNNNMQNNTSNILQTLLGGGNGSGLGNLIGGFLGGGSKKGGLLTMAALTLAPDLIRNFTGTKKKDLEKQNSFLEQKAMEAEKNTLKITEALEKMEERVRQAETKAIEATATTNAIMAMSNRNMERENSNLEAQIQQLSQQIGNQNQTNPAPNINVAPQPEINNFDTSSLSDDTGTSGAVVEAKKPEKTKTNKKTKAKTR